MRVLVGLAFALSTACAADAGRLDFSCSEQPAAEVLAALNSMGVELTAETALLHDAATQPLTFALHHADAAALRQAVALAWGVWWIPDQGRGFICTRARELTTGPLRAQTYTTDLRHEPGVETQVHALMTPWLGGDAGLSLLPAEGLWSACLDADGHAQLSTLLTLLEYPRVQCPPLLPDVALPDADARLSQPLRADSMNALAQALAAAGVSVAVAADARDATVAVRLEREHLAELPRLLRAQGVRSAWRQGVLCLGLTTPDDRQHPALRRRIAVVPVTNLVHHDGDGELLTDLLLKKVRPSAWRAPGYGVVFRARFRCLIVCADAALIHSVLDALDRLDRDGLANGATLLGDLGDESASLAP